MNKKLEKWLQNRVKKKNDLKSLVVIYVKYESIMLIVYKFVYHTSWNSTFWVGIVNRKNKLKKQYQHNVRWFILLFHINSACIASTV